MADPQGAGSDIFGQGPNPSLGAQSQAGNNRSEKQVNKQEDYTNMYQQVQQYKEDEHQKKLANQDQKARLNEDLRRQIEENKRIKDAKERDEKNRDAALQREHDRILLDREAQRNSKRLQDPRTAPQAPPPASAYDPALGVTPGGRGRPRPDNLSVQNDGGFFGGGSTQSGRDQQAQKKKQEQQAYFAMLQQQVDEKSKQKASEKATIHQETLQREQYQALKSNQPLPPSRRQPQEAPTQPGYGRGPASPSYFEEAPTKETYQPPQDSYMPEQASYADDAEFQRRLAEYKEEELAALEAKLAQQNGYGNSSGYGDNSGLGRDGYRGNSSEAPEGYGRGDEYPAYQRGEDLPTYQRGDEHPAYQRQAEVVPSKGFTAANPYSGEAKQEPIRNGIQRNYLVNNPLVPDQPAQRAAAPQGFRAHQDIKHDQMNIPRGQKSGGMYGSSAQEAYSNIKKKYGNHSAQYNILTGN